MTPATKTRKNLNAWDEQLTQLNVRLVQTGKRAGNLYLDSCDELVDGVTEYQRTLAEHTRHHALQSAISTQADLTRELASTCTSAARELIA